VARGRSIVLHVHLFVWPAGAQHRPSSARIGSKARRCRWRRAIEFRPGPVRRAAVAALRTAHTIEAQMVAGGENLEREREGIVVAFVWPLRIVCLCRRLCIGRPSEGRADLSWAGLGPSECDHLSKCSRRARCNSRISSASEPAGWPAKMAQGKKVASSECGKSGGGASFLLFA
jgi:hypothetical protein